MSTVTSTGAKPKATIFETLLSSPGMGEKNKINLLLSRQNIIVFVHLLETGLASSKGAVTDGIMAALPEGTLEEIAVVRDEILQKGGLTEFYEKLKSL